MTRPRFLIHITTCLTASLSLAVSRVAPAADPPTKSVAKSLDEQLLQGLESKDKPEQKPSEQKPATKKSSPHPDSLDEQLKDSLSGGEDVGQPGEDERNPLARIVVHMREVQQRLAESNSDNRTQQEQKQISEELKSLIEQLAQQQQQSQNSQSSSQQSSRDKPKQGNTPTGKAPTGDPDKEPAKNSSPGVRKNHAERPDPAAAREVVRKELDRLHLPDKDREEMLQAPPDEFLPGHESSIEEYFKRLVEQEEEKP